MASVAAVPAPATHFTPQLSVLIPPPVSASASAASASSNGSSEYYDDDEDYEDDFVDDGYGMPAQSPIQPFSINTVILDSESGQEYQLMRLLGSGSYALVYLARELSTGNQYAIKCLSKLYLTPEQMELQRQEAVIHAKAGPHPYIVRMHRSFDHDDWLFLLIEYVDGTDLYDWITERPIPSESAFANQAVANKRARETAELFKQILDAVAWIHARGIFHRDLKPENFMCSSSGSNVSIKLTDFGLATMETLTDDFECGSAPYMAAENRHPYWPTYSPAANDIWSLGIILINMTYGVQLWQDPHPSDSNFAKFLEDGAAFIERRTCGARAGFSNKAVAQFLTDRVFCSPDVRCDITEFQQWATKTLQHGDKVYALPKKPNFIQRHIPASLFSSASSSNTTTAAASPVITPAPASPVKVSTSAATAVFSPTSSTCCSPTSTTNKFAQRYPLLSIPSKLFRSNAVSRNPTGQFGAVDLPDITGVRSELCSPTTPFLSPAGVIPGPLARQSSGLDDSFFARIHNHSAHRSTTVAVDQSVASPLSPTSAHYRPMLHRIERRFSDIDSLMGKIAGAAVHAGGCAAMQSSKLRDIPIAAPTPVIAPNPAEATAPSPYGPGCPVKALDSAQSLASTLVGSITDISLSSVTSPIMGISSAATPASTTNASLVSATIAVAPQPVKIAAPKVTADLPDTLASSSNSGFGSLKMSFNWADDDDDDLDPVILASLSFKDNVVAHPGHSLTTRTSQLNLNDQVQPNSIAATNVDSAVMLSDSDDDDECPAGGNCAIFDVEQTESIQQHTAPLSTNHRINGYGAVPSSADSAVLMRLLQ